MKRDIMADDDDGRTIRPGFDEDIQAKIGSQLKSIYDTVLDEPVPDRIAGLLKQLEKATASDTNRGKE
ncbi:NepR family anti-sigma factor [Breoghania sp. JC706]|uniref:NepR family anti-sigma factor n=1 Tax=Breoghania sp. JC706 TaxID=3117732 RepID=UPI00300995B5